MGTVEIKAGNFLSQNENAYLSGEGYYTKDNHFSISSLKGSALQVGLKVKYIGNINNCSN